VEEGLVRNLILPAVAMLVVTAGCGAGSSSGLTTELTYVRSGGFAGVEEHLVINPDGRASLTDGFAHVRGFTLTQDELDRVIGALEGAGLSELPSDSTSRKPVPDSFSYAVTFGGTEVRSDDQGAPPELRTLLSELDRIVQDHRTR
jgi:hypothetical protein